MPLELSPADLKITFWMGGVYFYGILGFAFMIRDHFGARWGYAAWAAGFLFAVYRIR